jgi:hypothetical protein
VPDAAGNLRQGAHLFETAATAKQVYTQFQFPKCPTESSAVLSEILCLLSFITKLGEKQADLHIVRVKMFATRDKAKPNTGSVRGLNLTEV